MHVQTGQQIGVTGNTGTVTTGPHLHVQIFDAIGRRVDPEEYFAMPTNNLTWEEINVLYRLKFGRDADEGARGYVGKNLLFVAAELDKSVEGKAVSAMLAAAQLFKPL